MRKSINELNKHQSIAITFYQYAPESFKAFIKTVSTNKNIPYYEQIALDDKVNYGSLAVCKEYEKLMKALKKLVRTQRQTKARQFLTYGFAEKDNASGYGFIRDMTCNADAPYTEKKALFNRIKKCFAENDYKLNDFTTVDLGKDYKIDNITKHLTEFDQNKAVIIWGN